MGGYPENYRLCLLKTAIYPVCSDNDTTERGTGFIVIVTEKWLKIPVQNKGKIPKGLTSYHTDQQMRTPLDELNDEFYESMKCRMKKCLAIYSTYLNVQISEFTPGDIRNNWCKNVPKTCRFSRHFYEKSYENTP